mmetsp:Transcript_18378/g.51498  ORF Transcript_18378/g.51498 Transcript_18378/m.51498 type:complete len:130 (-) Transcript_18378:25-414(-)
MYCAGATTLALRWGGAARPLGSPLPQLRVCLVLLVGSCFLWHATSAPRPAEPTLNSMEVEGLAGCVCVWLVRNTWLQNPADTVATDKIVLGHRRLSKRHLVSSCLAETAKALQAKVESRSAGDDAVQQR